MAEQLHFWDREDDDYVDSDLFEYPTPPEPPAPLPPEPTSLDRDLELLYLDYLAQSARRIASASEVSQQARRDEYLRKINYEVAIGKLTAEQRDILQEIVWGQRHQGQSGK